MEKSSELLKECTEKIKVSSAEIVVHGTREKPYYEIKYHDLSDGQTRVGYSSYNLDFVFEWLEECFEIINQVADTTEDLSAKLQAENMENDGGWIAIAERLPTKEESIKNDNRFILDDGNRRYEGCFDYIEKRFVRFNCDGMQTDKCVIAWREMLERYRP